MMRKINYKDCSNYVKKELKINLIPYQEKMLEAFCEGKEARVARGLGRTFIADCFGKYVAHLYSENDYTKNPDVSLSYEDGERYGVYPEGFIEKMKNEMTEKQFRREYICR